MIATRRGLLVLFVIAIALSAWLVRALTAARPEPVDRAIAPGLDPDRASSLVWDRSPLPAVTITPVQGGGWRWASAESWAAADGSVVRDVLAALRAGRWHRRAAAKAAGTLRSQLTVTVGTTSRTIGIGQPLEGTEQQWLVAGDDALLVDRWVARALDPDPLALRVRHPVDSASSAPEVTLTLFATALRLEGSPRRLIVPRDGQVPAVFIPRPAVIHRLDTALEALEIVRLSRPARDEDVTLMVRMGITVRIAPTCPDDPALSWLFSDAGNGCIARAAYDELMAAAAELTRSTGDLVDPRPVPFDPTAITLVDGTAIDLIRGKADPASVAELLAALGAPAAVVPDVATPVKGQLHVTLRAGGMIDLELLGDGRVRRSGEPLVLRLGPAAYAALTRRAADVADRSLWNEEATTITEVQIDAVVYRRGAVLGEWTRTPAGPVDGARIEALVTVLAQVQSSPVAGPPSKEHDVAIVVTPPAGAPVRHALVVGVPRQGGCSAYAGQATTLLPAKVCADIAALAR